MPIRILGSSGDNRKFRMDGREKFRRRRIFAPVVRDFQHVGKERSINALGKEGRFRLCLCITR